MASLDETGRSPQTREVQGRHPPQQEAATGEEIRLRPLRTGVGNLRGGMKWARQAASFESHPSPSYVIRSAYLSTEPFPRMQCPHWDLGVDSRNHSPFPDLQEARQWGGTPPLPWTQEQSRNTSHPPFTSHPFLSLKACLSFQLLNKTLQKTERERHQVTASNNQQQPSTQMA